MDQCALVFCRKFKRHVDCRPDDEEEEEVSADKRFRLSEKDIADICIAILITLLSTA
jgi:hypothetical protein